MRTLFTYYIIGWAIDSEKHWMREAKDYVQRIRLILVDPEGTIKFRHYGLLYKGTIRHGIGKASTYFKFTQITKGIRSPIKAVVVDRQPDNFLGNFVTYDPTLKKWVKTPECKKFKLKITPLLQMFVNSSLFSEVHLIDELKGIV